MLTCRTIGLTLIRRAAAPLWVHHDPLPSPCSAADARARARHVPVTFFRRRRAAVPRAVAGRPRRRVRGLDVGRYPGLGWAPGPRPGRVARTGWRPVRAPGRP